MANNLSLFEKKERALTTRCGEGSVAFNWELIIPLLLTTSIVRDSSLSLKDKRKRT
jgi:hypothetical protein